MSKILAVRVENQLIKLLPHDSERFGLLFEIDSVSLLLGTNGSGKTRILTCLANGVGSSQDESFQFYFQGTPNGHIEPNAPYNKNLCAVYYSALPYKRKLIRKRGVFNASPGVKSSTDNRRLEKFGEIAEILKIETHLTGFLGYSRNVFRMLIIPVIRNVKEVSLSILKKLIFKLDEISKDLANEKSNNYQFYDQEREFILNDMERILEDEINKRFGKRRGFVFLSTLESMHLNGNKVFSKKATLALLNHIGIVEDGEQSDFLELDSIVENTRGILSKYCSPKVIDDGYRNIRFKIDNVEISRKIGEHETHIQIEWSNQSSGLQALVEQFSLIDDAIGKAVEKGYSSVLLLIDEGDAYLHLEWQRKYFSILNKFLGGLKKKYFLKNLQLIMATHSPLLAADIPGEFVTSLDTKKSINSFAAPMEEVIAGAFSSNSIGEFAATKINEIYKRARLGKTTQADRDLVDAIGDISIKSALKKEFR